MKLKQLFIFFVMMVFFLSASITFAQHGGGSKGGGANASPFFKLFNSETIVEFGGFVESIYRTPPLKGIHYDVNMKVNSGKESFVVHLGPEWYIDRLEKKIVKGIYVYGKGSRVIFEDKPVIIAMEVIKGGVTIPLRDKTGKAVWETPEKTVK
jgi:hypothetical protein